MHKVLFVKGKLTTLYIANYKEYDKMSKAMDNKKDFAEWLQERMTQLDLSQSELARRANVDRQVVWGYLNRKVLKPDEKVLLKIAKVLQVSPTAIFQAAWILDIQKQENEITKEISYLVADLPEEDQQDVIEYIRHRLALAEKRGKSDTKKRIATAK